MPGALGRFETRLFLDTFLQAATLISTTIRGGIRLGVLLTLLTAGCKPPAPSNSVDKTPSAPVQSAITAAGDSLSPPPLTIEQAVQHVPAMSVNAIEDHSPEITDADVSKLREMANLESLTLTNAQLTDAGVQHLAGLKRLKTLVLGNSTITDVGLRSLAAHGTLQVLNVNETSVTDDGLQALAALKQLTLLRFGSSKIRGRGLKHLAGLPLTFLILQNAPLDDSGLEALADCPSLESLYVQNTLVTDAGLNRLTSRLPRLHIH